MSTITSKHGSNWTKEEDRILRQYYQRLGSKWVAAKIGRTYKSVQRRARALGVQGRGKRWTKFEDSYIRKKYGKKLTARQIAKTLGRTEGQVRHKIHELQLGSYHPKAWTEKEIGYLKRHYGKKTIAEIASKLQRTEAAVGLKVRKLGLSQQKVGSKPNAKQQEYIKANLGKVPYTVMAERTGLHLSRIIQYTEEIGYKARPTSRPWTEKDLKLLRKLWGTKPRAEVAVALNRTLVAAAMKASELGLTTDHRKDYQSGRWTSTEDRYVMKYYQRHGKVRVAEKLGRTPCAVEFRARRIGATKRVQFWTPEEEAQLKKLFGRMTYAEIGKILGRTKGAVGRKAIKLGLRLRADQRKAILKG